MVENTPRDNFRPVSYYDGSKPTSRRLGDLLPGMMSKLGSLYKSQPEVLLNAWQSVIGEKFFPFTRAQRFESGVLTVLVKNSTLFSLLNNPVDKQRLITELRKRVPGAVLNQIVFRIG